MINQIPQDQNNFTTWIIGLGVAGFGALFAFIKWLVGIQVKKIDTLTEKVNELENKITENTTYDKTGKETTKDRMDRMQIQLDTVQEKIEGQIIHDIQFLKDKINECKYCNLKK